MNAAICEDDKEHLDLLLALLDKYNQLRPGVHMRPHSFISGNELLKAIHNGKRFDLFLLDILMPEKDGIALARELRAYNLHAPLVFLTSSGDYALDAFGVSAMQYLVKPIWEESLFPVLDKSVALFEFQKSEDSFLIVFMPGETVKIPYSSLVCVESYQRTLYVHLTDGSKLRSKAYRESFEVVTAPLLRDSRFLHAHKSYILNMTYVEKLTNRSFVMKGGTVISVPRYKYADMKTRYFNFLSQNSNSPSKNHQIQNLPVASEYAILSAIHKEGETI